MKTRSQQLPVLLYTALAGKKKLRLFPEFYQRQEFVRGVKRSAQQAKKGFKPPVKPNEVQPAP